jgi:hypothetical protein
MSESIDTQLVYIVDRDNKAAWSAYMKIIESRPRPGSIIPLTHEEFEAVRSGSIALAWAPITGEK